uniref:SERPIN domain-containing protein n=1 Tax=Steinernema glaseri TaxID=37863 RepID=A0A1I7Z452_9BILA
VVRPGFHPPVSIRSLKTAETGSTTCFQRSFVPPIAIASRLYVENGLKLVERFESDIKQHFATEVERLDFSGAPQQQAARINDFVKNTTLGQIDRIIDDASINEGTRLILVNALYLHLRFDKQFSSKGLEKERFVMESSEVKEVRRNFFSRNIAFGYQYL